MVRSVRAAVLGLLFVAPVVHADLSPRHTIYLGAGFSFDRGCDGCDNPHNHFGSVGYRYYPTRLGKLRYPDSGWFVEARMNAWDGGDAGSDHQGIWVGAGGGYRTEGMSWPKVGNRWFAEFSFDYGGLNNPDGRNDDGEGKLTQQGQFHITFGAGYRVNKCTTVFGGYRHLSNGHKVFHRDASSEPNNGRDWLGIEVEMPLRCNK